MLERIAIEFLSRMSLPPLESVRLTEQLGCRYLGVCFVPYVANPHQYPKYSLRDEPALRRAMISEMADRNVAISIGEGFMVMPRADIAESRADLDLMVELGAPRVNILSLDRDLARSLDQIATFVDLAEERDLDVTLEFVPNLVIGDLLTALTALRHVGKPTLKLNIDFMHLYRSGGTAQDIMALDPLLVGYAQLCDVPLTAAVSNYADEACNYRLPPGEGELPIQDILRAIPRDVPIGVEIPMLRQAQKGIGTFDRLAPCVDRTRELLAKL